MSVAQILAVVADYMRRRYPSFTGHPIVDQEFSPGRGDDDPGSVR